MDDKTTTRREYKGIQKRLLGTVIKYNKFSKMQEKLLRALSTFYPVTARTLEIKTGSTSIRSLIRDTNAHLRKLKYKRPIQIVSLFKETHHNGDYGIDLNLPTSQKN